MRNASVLLALVLAALPAFAMPANAAEDALLCPGDLRVYAIVPLPLGGTLGVSETCPAGIDGRQLDYTLSTIRIAWVHQAAGLQDVEAVLHGKGHAGTVVTLAEVPHTDTGTGESYINYESDVLNVPQTGRLDIALYHDGVLVATTYVY